MNFTNPFDPWLFYDDWCKRQSDGVSHAPSSGDNPATIRLQEQRLISAYVKARDEEREKYLTRLEENEEAFKKLMEQQWGLSVYSIQARRLLHKTVWNRDPRASWLDRANNYSEYVALMHQARL